MAVQFSQIINKENDIENKINFYMFNSILVYIIIVIDKIITLLKSLLLRRKEILYFQLLELQNVLTHCKNDLFEIKNNKRMNLIIIDKNKLKKNNDTIKDIQIKKRRNNINDINIIIINNIIINLIKFIIINIFC